MNRRIKTIAICSSGSFYKQVLEAEKELRKQGFKVKIPSTARKMRKSGDFDAEHYKTWFKNPAHYHVKAKLIRRHFKKILESDAILILNYEKNGMAGYIGGNTLMEMALAFHLRKPIYILNLVLESSPLYEEIMGMGPIFLNGDLKKI